MEIEVLDQLFIRSVAEAYILYIHLALYVIDRAGSIRAFRRLLQKSEDPGRACKGVLELSDHGADVVEGLHILVCVGEKYGKSSDGQISAGDEERAYKSHRRVDHIVYETGGRIGKAAEKHRFLAVFFQFLIDLGKPRGGFFFIAERLDQLLISDHLFNESCLASSGVTLLSEHLERASGNKFCHKETQWRQHDHKKGDPYILGKHEYQSSDDSDDSREKLGKSKQKSVGENIGIRDHPADNISGAVLVQIGQRQFLDMPDGFCADVSYGVIGHAVVDDIHDPGCSSGYDHHNKDSGQIIPHTVKVHLSLADDLIYGVAEKDGNVELKDH